MTQGIGLGSGAARRLAVSLALIVVLSGAAVAFAVVTELDGYEPDDTPGTAQPLVLGATKQTRTLHYSPPDGDVDWATFAAVGGVRYLVQTGDLDPDTTDTVLELYAPDGVTLLASNDDYSGFSFASRIAWQAPADGTYHVRVRPRHGGINGNYSLQLSEAGWFSGKVIDRDRGTALSGITVDLWQWDQDGYYAQCETTTDSQGRYLFNAVAPGVYRIGFHDWSGDYRPTYYNNRTSAEAGHDFVVIAGQESTLTDIGLQPVKAWTTVTLSTASVTLPKYGASYVVKGRLKAGSASLSNKTVILQSAAVKSGPYRDTAVKAVTRTDGTFEMQATPRVATWYRVRYNGDASTAQSHSDAVRVRPRASVTTPVAPKVMYSKRSRVIYGYIRPAHKAGTRPVRIYRYKRTASGAWKSHGYVTAKASDYNGYTKYTVRMSLPSTGRWRLRAYHPTDSGHVKSWSPKYRYVTVK